MAHLCTNISLKSDVGLFFIRTVFKLASQTEIRGPHVICMGVCSTHRHTGVLYIIKNDGPHIYNYIYAAVSLSVIDSI